MSKPNTSLALAMVGSPELLADDQQLARLQQGAIEQFRRLVLLREEEALRGLLLGLTLHRIKASLPYGAFGKWAKEQSTFSARWTNYLMRLSLVFIDQAKIAKPELLACPGDQAELALEGLEGAQARFVAKARKFVGTHSLNELFEAYGIKEAQKLGGTREALPSTEAETAAEPATAEALAAAARDEIGAAIERVESLILKEARLAHCAGDHAFLRGVAEALGNLALKSDEKIRELLALSGDAAARRSLGYAAAPSVPSV